MTKIIILLFGFIFFSSNSFSQNYPNNEDGQFQDMLTPAYYNAPNGDDFRNDLNCFFRFARLVPFQHPLENPLGEISIYNVHRAFGDEISQNGIVLQHHPATDMYIGNAESEVELFASIDGYVETFQDAPKYRDYLTISKNVEDSVGNIVGKIVVFYGHIDLDLDISDGLSLNGQSVNKGDTISKHLYSETMGGAHLHFEIRYYKPSDIGNEDYYGWAGGSSAYTEPSSGPWSYGYWDTNFGYGFANAENHFNYSDVSIESVNIEDNISIFPNPVNDFLQINIDNYEQSCLTVFDITGKVILEKTFHKTIRLNTQNFKKGVYFIEIKTQNKLLTKKLIKT